MRRIRYSIIFTTVHVRSIVDRQTEFMTSSGKGECRVCGARHTASGMAPHMNKHMADAFGDPNRFVIRTDQGAGGPFWMYVRVSTEATFGVLDRFLRAVWMECCGHLSEFTAGGKSAGMRKRLSALLSDGSEFVYRYDMGDTTGLRLTVLGRSARVIDLGGWVRSDAYSPPPPHGGGRGQGPNRGPARQGAIQLRGMRKRGNLRVPPVHL